MLNESKLIAAAKAFRAMFYGALEQSPTLERRLLQLLAMEVPSTGDTESYNWLGQVPNMREWVGDRVMKDLEEFEFSIKNKKFEASVQVLAETIEDDKLGMVRPRIQGLADAYWRKRWSLVLSLLTACKTTYCYDGKYFVAANHSEGDSGTQSNIETDLLDADAYFEARYTMQNLKDDQGNSLGIQPTHLLVCPALEQTALEIVRPHNSYGAENVWANSAEVVVVPGFDAGGMTSLKAWALADLNKPLKPFIDQVRRPVRFTALEALSDFNVFMRDEFFYGTDYRGNAGVGLWQLIRVSDGSGS
jgi:phage major head subunit gpT-like protein